MALGLFGFSATHRRISVANHKQKKRDNYFPLSLLQRYKMYSLIDICCFAASSLIFCFSSSDTRIIIFSFFIIRYLHCILTKNSVCIVSARAWSLQFFSIFSLFNHIVTTSKKSHFVKIILNLFISFI